MTLSDEMIEEAAEAGWREEARLFGKIRLRSDARLSDQAPSTQEKWRAYARAMVLASVPSLRKQVLEEAIEQCGKTRDRAGEHGSKYDYFFGKSSGAVECEARIRSLMDKG